MNSESENELNMLEEKVLDLEFKELEKQFADTRRFLITPKTPAKIPQKSSMELSITRRSGKTVYSMRSASGDRTVLSADRKNWPSDIRELVERIEEIDKKRMQNGRMISVAV